MSLPKETIYNCSVGYVTFHNAHIYRNISQKFMPSGKNSVKFGPRKPYLLHNKKTNKYLLIKLRFTCS